MYNYAQIKNNICIGVSMLSDEVSNDNLILIPNYYEELLLSTYDNVSFTKYKIIEGELSIVYQWQKFDLGQGVYVDDITNNTPIIIDDIEYIPINGKVEIQK
jgi:hypothetical protein